MKALNLIPVGDPADETFTLNLGPQHPATHGVLRVKLVMDGEYITSAQPVIGYIHRMHEKMGENRTWAQYLPNTSRVDYLSAMTYTHAFVGVVERALKIEVPQRAEYIRVTDSDAVAIQPLSVQVNVFKYDRLPFQGTYGRVRYMKWYYELFHSAGQ